MGEHFLQWINIVDFKCFHNFEAKDFKRVNLISGKNNVGKTAFMEACYINANTNDISSFAESIFRIKYSREKLNELNNLVQHKNFDIQNYFEATKLYHSISNKHKLGYRLENSDGIKEYIFNINDDIKIINANNFSLESMNSNVSFLDNFGISNYRLGLFYTAIQEKDQEYKLNDLIRLFDSSIDSFKLIGEKPQCKFNGEYIDITEFGDGLKHYISIICALYACENSQLFIDEIENGIHYTHLDQLWEIILKVSKEQNVQVFATTHSKECIESYLRAAKKLEEKEITSIRISRLKDGSLIAGVRDFDLLNNTISQEHEVR
jgi:AAA15 family ATPase/GTPase